MRKILLFKNKLKFVDGNIKIPDQEYATYETWERCNVMILSWFTRTLEPQIPESIVYVDIVKSLWEDLKERFSRGDYFRISYLLQEIHLVKQGKSGCHTVLHIFEDLMGETQIFEARSSL